MASVVSVSNLALQKLGAKRIVSLTQDSNNARECNACYAHVRDSELRKRSWGFARDFAQLAASGTTPLFGYTYAYLKPADCLRILPPNDPALDWRQVGSYIYTNWGAPLDLEYIRRVTDVNQMDSLFQEAWACKMAWQMCEAITQSNQKKTDIRDEYRDAIREARQVGSFEDIAGEAPEDPWLVAMR